MPRRPILPRASGDRTSRTAALMIRLLPEEKKALQAAARRAGLGLGPWLRMLGLRSASQDGER
jgi:hypothetical protein